MAEGESQAELLSAALRTHAMSARRCGTLFAQEAKIKTESGRRQIQRWLGGEGISDENAEALARVFEYPPDYFKQPLRERRRPWEEELAGLRKALASLEARLQAVEGHHPPQQESDASTKEGQ